MTLTNETIKLWRNNAEITAGETAEDDPEHIAAKAILALTSELLANREAQTAACDIERIKRHALPAGECPRQSQVVLLSSLKRLLTAPPAPAPAPAPAVPDGFKLMPLEMTDEIGEAIAMEARCCGGIALCIYESALAAAPEGGNGA